MKALVASLVLVVALMLGQGPVSAAPSVVPDVPGALNPDVTQENIHTTICVKGWTATVRPSRALSGKLKHKLYRSHHLTGRLRAYEMDHLYPLELGGAPTALANLWMEPIRAARRTDKVENRLHRDVCAGRRTLAEAQELIKKRKDTHG